MLYIMHISNCYLGLDLLNANQDLKMLATIKETTIGNKERIENMKRELGLFSQHMKRLDQPRGKSPESCAPGYDQGVLNTVRDHLTVIQEEQGKMALKSEEDFAGIRENLDQKQVRFFRCVSRRVGRCVCRWLCMVVGWVVRLVRTCPAG